MWRNNGNGTFTDVTDATGLVGDRPRRSALGTDYNNDRAIDIVVVTGLGKDAYGLSKSARRQVPGA